MDIQSYEWVVTALAEEIAAERTPDKAIAALRARLGYACADPGFGADALVEQARIDLVERIAGRIEARREAAPVRLVRRAEIAA